MMMDDGRLALLDFGQTKELLPATRALFASLVEMLAEGDEDTIRDAMAAAGLDVSVKADEADGDTSSLWEVFYSMPVTDNITVTPALFGIADNGGTADVFGGIVKTTFKF